MSSSWNIASQMIDAMASDYTDPAEFDRGVGDRIELQIQIQEWVEEYLENTGGVLNDSPRDLVMLWEMHQ